MTGPKRLKTLKIKVWRRHYLSWRWGWKGTLSPTIPATITVSHDRYVFNLTVRKMYYTLWTKYKNGEYDKSKEKPKEE